MGPLSGRDRGPPLIEAGPVNKEEEGPRYPQLELLKNEMKIRGRRGEGPAPKFKSK